LTAGAIFLGPWSPTVLGDYVAGPSHTLPTGGRGASFAGLTVDQFQRRTSVVEYNRASLKKALPAVKKFAELEGLGAMENQRKCELRVDLKPQSNYEYQRNAFVLSGCFNQCFPEKTLAWEIHVAKGTPTVADIAKRYVQSARNDLGLKPTTKGAPHAFIQALRKSNFMDKTQPKEDGWSDAWRLLIFQATRWFALYPIIPLFNKHSPTIQRRANPKVSSNIRFHFVRLHFPSYS